VEQRIDGILAKSLNVTGKVGIGVETATRPLEVLGDVKIDEGTLILESCDPSDGATCNTGSIKVEGGPLIISSSGWGTYFNIDTDKGSNDNYTFYSDCDVGACIASDIVARFNGVHASPTTSKKIYFPGSLGLGVSTPDFKLHIKENDFKQLAFDRTDSGSVDSKYYLGPSFDSIGATGREWLGVHSDVSGNLVLFEENGAVGIGETANSMGGFGERNGGNTKFTLGKLVVVGDADEDGGFIALARNDDDVNLGDIIGGINWVSDDAQLCGGTSNGNLCDANGPDGEEYQRVAAIEVSADIISYLPLTIFNKMEFKLRGREIDDAGIVGVDNNVLSTRMVINAAPGLTDTVTINGNLTVNGVVTAAGIGIGGTERLEFGWDIGATFGLNEPVDDEFGPGVGWISVQGVDYASADTFQGAASKSPGSVETSKFCCTCDNTFGSVSVGVAGVGQCTLTFVRSATDNPMTISNGYNLWLNNNNTALATMTMKNEDLPRFCGLTATGGTIGDPCVTDNDCNQVLGACEGQVFEKCVDFTATIAENRLLAVQVMGIGVDPLFDDTCGLYSCNCSIDYKFN
jgi:hypothetical protein